MPAPGVDRRRPRSPKMCVYQLLREIQEILQDDALQDPECFWRIERLVCLFEENGLSAGIWHDFG